MANASDNSLKLFEFSNGVISGHDDATEAEHFAADFRGLRHFAGKISEALDIGDVWMGGFREQDFTLLWTCSVDGQTGQGAMLDGKAPFFEVLQNVSTEG